MKRVTRPKTLRFSNLKLLQATRNVHALINNKANEYLQQHELSRNFKSIQYRVNKFLADFEKFQICLSISVEKRIKIYETTRYYGNRYRKKISKSWLYKGQNLFINNFIHTCTYSLEKSLSKPKTPKRIYGKYNPNQRNELATVGHERNPLKLFNLSDYLYKVRTCQIRLTTFDEQLQKHISFPTLKSAVNEFYKRVPMPKPYRKHKLLKYLLPLGHLQFDIKVIGACDNKFARNIYCIDIVDERSGMVYGVASLSYPKQLIIKVLKEAYEYFESYFKISRIRTDHALTFKRTEALDTGEFNDLLVSMNTNHQYSIGGQPETNGKIENVHEQIDKELLTHINKCETIEESIQLINDGYAAYNNERTKGYKLGNRKEQKGDSYRMTPIQSLTFDYGLYT